MFYNVETPNISGGDFDSSQWLDSFESVDRKDLFTDVFASYILSPVDGGPVRVFLCFDVRGCLRDTVFN